MSNNIKVLLVEDQELFRMGIEVSIGKMEGIELSGQAENGLEAVEKAIALNPDVILMDIGLPEIDGIEATKRIRDNHLNSKILMFTSRESQEDVFAALRAGADGYVMKGVNPQQLASAISAVNEGTAWLDPAIAKLVLQSATSQSVSSKDPAQFIKNCGLTSREIEVLKLIVDGMKNPEIAETLVISIATAKAHVHSILQKLCVENRTQATITAIKEGIIQ